MKIVLITDTHFGVRNDNSTFSDYQYKFYNDVFFPYLKSSGIKTIIHLGDLMDRRKYVSFLTLDRMRKELIAPLRQLDVTMHTIVGNHDTYYKNTVEVNSVQGLFDIDEMPNPIKAYSVPTELKLEDGTSVDLIPWINQDNEDAVMKFIANSTRQIAFGHFDLQGFEMSKGLKSMYNSRPSDFLRGYDKAFSGHFHTKNDNGHIYYLGNPYEMTWSDYNDDRGFHVYDTETREIEHIVNPYKMHYKLFYDDENIEEFKKNFDDQDFSGKIVKLIVVNKTDFEYFNIVVELLEKNTETLNVIEDYGLISNEQMNINTEDTITTLYKYVDNMNLENDKEVKRILNEVYTEALAL